MLNLIRVCGLVALVFVFAGRAQAQAEVEAEVEVDTTATPKAQPWSAAALLGYGTDFEEGDLNAFGLGLGLRGGYTLDMNVYLGAQLVYFLGDSVEALGNEVSIGQFTLGIEGGYDLWVDPVTIRPTLGLGLTIVSSTITQGALEADTSESYLYIAPGATVLYPLEDRYFVGADARLWFITSENSVTGLTLLLTGGMRF